MTSNICLSRHHAWLTLLNPLRLNPVLSFTVALVLAGWATESLVHASAAASLQPQAGDRPTPCRALRTNGCADALAQSLAPTRSPSLFETIPSALSAGMATSATQPSTFLAGDFRLADDRVGVLARSPSRSPHETVAPNSTVSDPHWLVQANQSETAPRRMSQFPLRLAAAVLADSGVPAPTDKVLRQGSQVLGVPSVQLQGVFKQEGGDTSARARLRGFYPVTPNAGFGAEVDLTTGRGFADSQSTGLNLNELYFAGSLPSLPTLRFVVGLMDLTSYFDRNSFAKDGATHFFNSVFQTNPALAAAGISSRPGLLVNWSVTDNIDLKATTFSSTRKLGDFHLDAFAGEVSVRFGTAIIRGTYVSSRDAGQRSGFQEIFDIPRLGDTGPRSGDREEAYGINGEFYIPSLKLGLFGRYGHYTNLALDTSGITYSAGLNLLDVFLPNDRLGLGYGRQLSNDDLRQARGDKNPDVLELFYDFRITPNLRAAVMLQERNEFSETVLGFRIRTDFDISSLFRRSR